MGRVNVVPACVATWMVEFLQMRNECQLWLQDFGGFGGVDTHVWMYDLEVDGAVGC